MKASIEIELRTREVYKLFQRKINNDRLFIQAVLHKFNTVMNRCKKQESIALVTYCQMERAIQEITQQFTDELFRFETLLSKKRFGGGKIDFIVQFRPTVIVSNPLAMELVRLIDVYDRLMAVLKLLRLAGCFETDEIYFGNVRRYQKMVNQTLSYFIFLPLVNRVQTAKMA